MGTGKTPLNFFSGLTNNYAFNGKLRSFIVKDSNNEITHKFIPCYRKADDVIGLYDSITETFYTNSGTGSLIKGEDA